MRRFLVIAALVFGASNAQGQDFFGRDNSAATKALNNGASAYVNPGARVNSTAAYNLFTALLDPTIGSINFENVALGATPFVTGFAGTSLHAKFTNNGRVTNRNGNFGDGGEGYQGRYSSTQASLTSTGRYFRNDGDYAINIFSNAGATVPGAAAAFGFWGVDIGDVGQNLTIRFLSNNSLVHSYTIASGQANDGNVLFYGFVTKAFTFDRIEFKSTRGGDVFAFDDFVLGTPADITTTTTPEPAALTLMATGLIGLALVRKRRRS